MREKDSPLWQNTLTVHHQLQVAMPHSAAARARPLEEDAHYRTLISGSQSVSEEPALLRGQNARCTASTHWTATTAVP